MYEQYMQTAGNTCLAFFGYLTRRTIAATRHAATATNRRFCCCNVRVVTLHPLVLCR